MNRNEKIEAILTFLGYKISQNEDHMYDLYSEPTLNHIFEDVESDDAFAKHYFTIPEMRFDTSWDWLVPIIQDLKISGKDKARAHELDNCLLGLDLEATFDCTVDIINDINGD